MALIAIGLSHKTAPVELRERLAMPADQLEEALERLLLHGGLTEAVILSTCNRVEIYGRPATDNAQALLTATQFLGDLYESPRIAPALYRYEAYDAIRHLFRVASGLDSLVVGETEILGQVKSAYLLAQQRGKTGKIINVLFQRALYVGKQVRTRTSISEGASSVGSIAVQLAERIFGELSHHRILLVGAGKMAEVTARHLLSQKAGEIVVLNRTLSKAEELARALNGSAGSMDRLSAELEHADIVVCSTSSEKPLITLAMVEPLMRARRGRSLYFVDIAVPRNVEPEVHGLDNAYVYNIDDLKSLVAENMGRRQGSVAMAEELVQNLAREFHDWAQAVVEGRTQALRHGAPPRSSESTQ